MGFLSLYRFATWVLAPLFTLALRLRLRRGKEHATRIGERRGIAGFERPEGRLIWLHAASVGEAQSALIVVKRLLARYPDLHILVTSGTVTSADLMAKNLPERAFHQFYPLDRFGWVLRFLDHWRPDAVLWMESELWPNMLRAVKKRDIPAILVNGRMSARSGKRWRFFGGAARDLLSVFSLLLVQSDADETIFQSLGASNVHVTGNVKFSASPLPYDEDALGHLRQGTGGRPLWLYASTHAGEEELACAVHRALQERYPDLLTIIVPRHPERRGDIAAVCSGMRLAFRGAGDDLTAETEIYIADTLGELGLFYRLSPISVIGRSFSDDGGGGHNPIEAAQLGSAVLTGPGIGYQRDIFDPMFACGAAEMVAEKDLLASQIDALLSDPQALLALQKCGAEFVATKTRIIDRIEAHVTGVLDKVLS